MFLPQNVSVHDACLIWPDINATNILPTWESEYFNISVNSLENSGMLLGVCRWYVSQPKALIKSRGDTGSEDRRLRNKC